jgi:hypothetical protein
LAEACHAIKVKFQQFQVISFASCIVVPTPMMVTSGGQTVGNTPFPPMVQDPVFGFKKRIKDSKQWDSVREMLRDQTCCKDVCDVLDAECVPKAAAKDIAFFAEKQKHVCAALEQILQTDHERKVIVHSHDANRIVQLICKELLQKSWRSLQRQ